jgi:conjugal transfer mating pair stabilization protein TraN
MMSSIAQLSLLKDMQGKFNSIFTGKEHQCSKHILSFKDCCGSGKGWGKSLGLGGCDDTEKILQKKRQARLCHYVGTYCAEKRLGVCIKKKSSFCCFGSKLLKAFHEQGRRQINLGWGAPKHPLCRGFTIKEIQRIDFSKLDLSEVFEDLMKNYQPQKLQGMGEKIGERLETIKRGLGPPGHSPSGLNPSGASSSSLRSRAKKLPKQRPEA